MRLDRLPEAQRSQRAPAARLPRSGVNRARGAAEAHAAVEAEVPIARRGDASDFRPRLFFATRPTRRCSSGGALQPCRPHLHLRCISFRRSAQKPGGQHFETGEAAAIARRRRCPVGRRALRSLGEDDQPLSLAQRSPVPITGVARGPRDMFRALFTEPFGARSYAQYTATPARTAKLTRATSGANADPRGWNDHPHRSLLTILPSCNGGFVRRPILGSAWSEFRGYESRCQRGAGSCRRPFGRT